MQTRRRTWLARRIVLGLALTALVVPGVAQARVDEGGFGQPNSVAEVSKGAVGGPRMQVTGTDEWTVTSECRGCRRSGETSSFDVGASLTTDLPSGMTREQLNAYLLARDGVEITRTQPRSNTADTLSVPQVVSSPGFDWGDAGIGAGIALGLVLLAGAAFQATRHLGRMQTA
jgi:hypothetical protein